MQFFTVFFDHFQSKIKDKKALSIALFLQSVMKLRHFA